MKLALNPEAAALPSEEQLLDRINRLHKRDDKACIGRVGVKNADGVPRLIVYAFTDAELDGVTRLLEDRNFFDELMPTTEETDEDGNVEVSFETIEHPHFEYLYAIRPSKLLHG
jgi:hypothetical protein